MKYVSWLIIIMLLVTSCAVPTEEQLRKERQEQFYYSNYMNVLSWAVVGMDESVIRDKIGEGRANRCLESTYSSMGYTVHEYMFYEVHSPDSENRKLLSWPLNTVWLTFINGKLDSVSTFK